VRIALNAAVEVGFETIGVDSYFVNSVTSDNVFNQITRKNLEVLEKIRNIEFNRFPISIEGRATELIENLILQNEIPNGECPIPYWISGNLENPETIEIDFEGNVTLCPGICIGNTKLEPLTEILNNYNVNEHSILSKIWKSGPIGLLDSAKSSGFDIKNRYVNECHLCYELRKHLHPQFSNLLAPKECYQ
jgi:hypothetical protein